MADGDRIDKLAERISKDADVVRRWVAIKTQEGQPYTAVKPFEPGMPPDLWPAVQQAIKEGDLPPLMPFTARGPVQFPVAEGDELMPLIEYPLKGLELFHEKVARPFGASLQRPFFESSWQAALGTLKHPFYVPPDSAEMERYRAKEDPMLRLPFGINIGPKGIAESLPYFAIPTGKVAQAAAPAVRRGAVQVGERVVPPARQFARAEAGGVRVPEVPPTRPPAPPVEPPVGVPVAGEPWGAIRKTNDVLPELPTHADMIVGGKFAQNRARQLAEKYGEFPGIKQILGKASPESLAREGSLERELFLWTESADRAGNFAMLSVAPLKNRARAFQIDNLGRITNIKAKPGVKDPSFAISDVFEHPSRYILDADQKWVVDFANKLTGGARMQREANKIFWNVMQTGEEGRFLPRGTAAMRGVGAKPSGPGKGAKTWSTDPHTKGRIYEEMEQGIQAGVPYEVNFPSVLEDYLKSHYRAIADKRLMESTAKFGGETAKQRMKWMFGGVREQATMSARRKQALDKAESALKRLGSYKGEQIPVPTINSVASWKRRVGGELLEDTMFPEIAERMRGLGRLKGLRQTQARKALMAEVQALQKNVTAAYWKDKNAVTQAMEIAKKPRMKEGVFVEDTVNALAFKGKIYPKEVADTLNKYFHQETTGWLKTLEDVNVVMRFLQTGYDVGAPLIQGVPLLTRNFPAWVKATVKHFQVLKDPQLRQKAFEDNFDDFVEYVANGGTLGSSDFMEAVMRGGPLTRLAAKVPYGTAIHQQTGVRAGEAFNTFIDFGKLYQYRALRTMAKRKGIAPREVVAHVEKALGAPSTKAAGIPSGWRTFEGFMLFAPRYTRAFVGLLFDAMQGGLRGAEARKALVAMLTAGLVVYTGIKYAQNGEITEEDFRDLYRKPSKALSIEVGGQHIGIGSVWVSGARVLSEIMAKAIKDPEGLVEWKGDNPIGRAVRTRVSPLVGFGWDVATGESYIGEQVDTPKKAMQHLLENQMTPFWLEGMIDQWRAGGGLGEIAQAGVTETAGLRVWPVSASEERRELRDKLAKEKYPVLGVKGWYEMPRALQNELRRTNEELQDLDKQVLEQKLKRGDSAETVDDWARATIRQRKYDERERLAGEVLAGKMDLGEYGQLTYKLSLETSGMYDLLELIQQYLDPSGQKDWEKWKEDHTHLLDKALDEYYDIERDEEKGKWLAKQPASVKQYIDYMTNYDWKKNLGPDAQRVQAMKDAQPSRGGLGGGDRQGIPAGTIGR